MATRKKANQVRARRKPVRTRRPGPPAHTTGRHVRRPKSAAQRQHVYRSLARLAALDRTELPSPRSVWDQLTWIEVRGLPDYLDPPRVASTLPDGRVIEADPPRDHEADGQHIQDVYRRAFQLADSAERQRVVRSYMANFPDLAFDRNGPGAWLWPRWQEWRARRGPDDRVLLSALAKGIQEQGWGWMSQDRAHAWQLAQAKRYLLASQAEFRAKAPNQADQESGTEAEAESLTEVYREWAETSRSQHRGVRRDADERLLLPLLKAIKEKTGYATSRSELLTKKLSGVLRTAVSARFGVRERDLH